MKYLIFIIVLVGLWNNRVLSQATIVTSPDGIVFERGNIDSAINPIIGQIVYDTSRSHDFIGVYIDSVWRQIVLNDDDHFFTKKEIFINTDSIPLGGPLPWWEGGIQFRGISKHGSQSMGLHATQRDSILIFYLVNDSGPNPNVPFIIDEMDVSIGAYLPESKLHVLAHRQKGGVRIEGVDSVRMVTLRLENTSPGGADFQMVSTGAGAQLGKDRFIIRDAKRNENRLIIDSLGVVKVGNIELFHNTQFESYYNVGPESFTPVNPSTYLWNMSHDGSAYGYLSSLAPHTDAPVALAPVHLSNKATISQIVTYTYDSTSVGSSTIQLIRQNILTQEVDLMASTNTSTTVIDDDGLYQLKDDTVLHSTTDNQNYRYFLRYIGGDNDLLRMYTVQFKYYPRRIH